ncbi:ABC transporter ATP-binding protein [Microbacterium sp. KSW-18]|uniref:ABC transporter ATP-binding protein n=1 Tax=Microbacterium aquilitoris TaxID=3067307 RepID=A0ABU3GQJ2_9MICO|nr:ABC transporter ATP-binding protein [Microbacterium sp. KSW-18]MDT3331829.1 ABC transporter ATP-binding protein [Microbacterium sp. KSW-18]
MSADVAPPAPRPKATGLHKGEIRPGVEKVDPIIVADGVKRIFGGLTAVDVDHVEIPRNAITALIGPNGAGKTTLFNLLTGFDKPNQGQWSFDGTNLAGIPAFKAARMGQVRTFQLTKSLGLLTVLENMKLGAPGQGGESIWRGILPFLWRKQENEIEEKARGLLARFKLDAKEKDFAASLSGGQRKLLEMARALMSDPTLVMLDEPMAGVNPALTQSLLDHILDLKDLGMTVLFVEHDMHMVRHIADWVIVMAEGKVVAEGPPDTVMKEQAVIDAYLGAHQDVDLGVVTGRYAGELTPEAEELLEAQHELQEAVEADATTHAAEDSSAPGTPAHAADRTEDDK